MGSYLYTTLEMLPAGAFTASLIDTVVSSESYTVVAVSLTITDTAAATDTLVNAGTTYVDVNPWTEDFSSDFGSGAPPIPGSLPLLDTVVSQDAFTAVFANAASLSDSATGTEFYAFPLAFSIPESATVSESLTGAGRFIATLADTPVTSETLTGVKATPPLGTTDTAVTSDIFTISNATVTIPPDTVVTSDSYTKGVTNYSFTLGDSAATSDIFSQSAYFKSLNDTVITNESIASSLSAFYNPWTDDFSSDFGSGGSDPGSQTQNDTVFAQDILVGTFNVSRTLSDSISSSDFLAFPLTFSQGDTLIPTETLSSALVGTPNDYADISNVAESLIGIVSTSRTLTDSAATSDSLTYVTGSAVSRADTAVVSESYVYVWAKASALTDSVTTSDSLTGTFFSLTKSLADSISSDDSLNLVVFTSGLTDDISSDDAYSVLAFNAPLSLNDTAATSEQYDAFASSLTFADFVAPTDLYVGAVHSDADVSDPAVVTSDDYPIVSLGLTNALTDTMASSEILSLGGIIASGFADSATVADALTANTFAVPYTFSDTAVVSDSFDPIAFSQRLNDSNSSSDSFVSLNFATTLTDTATATDDTIYVFSATDTIVDFVAPIDSLTVLALTLSLSDIVVTDEIILASDFILPVTLTDAAATSDNIIYNRGFPADLSDNISSSDSVILQSRGFMLELADTIFGTDKWINQGTSTVFSVTAVAVPTGGAVLLQFPGYFPLPLRPTTLTIERSVEGTDNWVTLYDGPPVGVFLDVGDSLPEPLDGNTAYLWRLSDNSGSTVIGPITPASFFVNEPDQLTQILIRSLQGAINNMVLPPGVQPVLVTTKMPMNGWQAMPFIVINLDLIQQTDTQIGEDFINPDATNVWTLFANAKRVWRVTVISQDAEERDFYRDSLLAVFRILKATAFGPIGFDVHHTFSATSYTNAQEWEGMAPGFYGADLMLEVNGIFPAVVLTNYPVILQVASNPTFDPNTFIERVYP